MTYKSITHRVLFIFCIIPLCVPTAVQPNHGASAYKYSLSLGFGGSALITAAAFTIYKKNAQQNKVFWSFKDFLKKYPHLLKQAISVRTKKFHLQHPWFCATVKLYLLGTTITLRHEYLQAKKTAESLQLEHYNKHRVGLSLAPTISERAQLPAWAKHPLPPERAIIPFTGNAIQDFDNSTQCVPIPSKTAPELLAERKEEEDELQNKDGVVLIERNLCCLFCHTPFTDGQTAYFYGKIRTLELPNGAATACPPTHLYHQGCISKWESSLNNGYAGDPKGCHYKCFASNAKPQERELRAELCSVIVQLRKHDNPNYAPLVPVENGTISNPHDENGIPVTSCQSCKKPFKHQEQVALANLHNQCGTNHLYHPDCFNYFRTTFDHTDPRARGGECWVIRGISCPSHCIDPIYNELGAAEDRAPTLATILLTDHEDKPEEPAIKPLIEMKKIQPLPADKKMQCQGCGKSTDTHKNRYWTEFTCATPTCAGEEPFQYCHQPEANKNQKPCLLQGAGCPNCTNPFPENTFKDKTWYKN